MKIPEPRLLCPLMFRIWKEFFFLSFSFFFFLGGGANFLGAITFDLFGFAKNLFTVDPICFFMLQFPDFVHQPNFCG